MVNVTIYKMLHMQIRIKHQIILLKSIRNISLSFYLFKKIYLTENYTKPFIIFAYFFLIFAYFFQFMLLKVTETLVLSTIQYPLFRFTVTIIRYLRVYAVYNRQYFHKFRVTNKCDSW